MLDVLSYVNERKRAMAYEVSRLPRAPRLAIVTDDRNFGANQSYIRSKTKFALDIGVACDVIVLKDEDKFIGNANDYDGIIVQYPFRNYGFDEFRTYVTKHVSPCRDVDGIGENSAFYACTPLGIVDYLDHLRHTKVIQGNVFVNVIGFGNLVGKPLAEMLQTTDEYEVYITRSTTPKADADVFHKASEVIVCATPKHNLITETFDGKIYIDCGCNLVDGKLLGNVSRDCYGPDKNITPVPNGVGRLTVLSLFGNLLDAYFSKE